MASDATSFAVSYVSDASGKVVHTRIYNVCCIILHYTSLQMGIAHSPVVSRFFLRYFFVSPPSTLIQTHSFDEKKANVHPEAKEEETKEGHANGGLFLFFVFVFCLYSLLCFASRSLPFCCC
jgi:hypothetical protein